MVYGELGSIVPCGLVKFAVCPIVIPRDEGEGVGPNDAGDGALKAPLGEFAACSVPGDCVSIIEGDGVTVLW